MTAVPLMAAVGTPTYVALTDRLRDEILSGTFPHGKRLTVAELVERYGVSPMPVREALRALHGEGLVTVLPHKGARVLSLDPKYVRNVYDIRSAIEAMLARRSLQNVSRNHIQRLEEAERRFAAAASGGSHEQVFSLDREFHRLLYSLADNEEGLRLYEHYNSISGTLRHLYGYSAHRRAEMIQDHEETIEALKTQDEERLTLSIWTQNGRGMNDLIAKLEQ